MVDKVDSAPSSIPTQKKRLYKGKFSQLIDDLVEAESVPLQIADKKRSEIVQKKEGIDKLQGLLSEFDTSVNELKTKSSFYKMKLESSHPDIIDGTISGLTVLGSYEFEVLGLAKTEKELAYGFPDKDETEVGFGYMLIEKDNADSFEVEISPDATLQDVAKKINESDQGVKAMVINTKYQPNPYRLIVLSEESGKEAKIHVDPDTTFLDFKEQVTGRNLEVLFEDVPVTDIDNELDEVIDGLVFSAKRAEPGTRVQINVTYDKEATSEEISTFVEKYNQIVTFASEQSGDPKKSKPGVLAGDSSVKTIMRQLQGSFISYNDTGSSYRTLAQIGITTNPKTGLLDIDKTKLDSALAENYEDVAKFFVRSENDPGLGGRISDTLKALKDPTSGVLKTRVKGIESMIKNQDKEIARKQEQLKTKTASIRRRFSSLESQVSSLESQGSFIAQKLGGT